MRIAILGFGREGKSLLRFLKKSLEHRGAKIEVLDRAWSKNYLKNLWRFNFVFRSPGVPYSTPELVRARRVGVKFSSATELFFKYCPSPIIGITGTKGKGTTSTLLYKILKAAGKDVRLVGNIGRPALDLLPKLKKTSLVVFELSSFQLHDLKHSPHIAVVLDIFPDHQDAHRTLSEYYGAKAAIARHQKPGDLVFFFARSARAEKIARSSRGKKIVVDLKRWTLFSPADLKIPGEHNYKNAVMAASVAQKLGIPRQTIILAVKNFRGMEHRLEFVRKVGNANFYNDSASTNPYTTAAAIHAFPRHQKILIAGGKDKGLDYKPLTRALKESDTKLAILFGENKKKIARAIRKCGVKIAFVPNLKTAVATTLKFIKNYDLKPITWTVVFSPGAASFDQFHDYANRGWQFKKAVKSL